MILLLLSFEELFVGGKRPAVWNCIQKSLIYLGKDWERGGQAQAEFVMFFSWVFISGMHKVEEHHFFDHCLLLFSAFTAGNGEQHGCRG